MKRTRKDRPTRPEPHLACTADQFKELVRANWSEAEFQRAVIDLAKAHGWLVHHTRAARTASGWRTPIQGDAGYPDLTLVHPKWGRAIVAELKTDRGQVSDAQRTWLAALNGAGVTAVVWRPSCFAAIERELGGES